MCPIRKTPWIKIYIALGSNVGDRKAFLRTAMLQLDQLEGFRVQRVSRFYETEPVGVVHQDLFLNAVLEGETTLSPKLLLGSLKAIEGDVGRIHREKWGPREIDLDLLLYGDLIVEEPDCVIPHPRLHERDFVLVPLSELNPGLIHPKLNKSIKTLLTESKKFDASHPKPYPVEVAGEAV